MRLINAEPLEKLYKGWIKELEDEDPIDSAGDIGGIEACLAALQDAPTVEINGNDYLNKEN